MGQVWEINSVILLYLLLEHPFKKAELTVQSDILLHEVY